MDKDEIQNKLQSAENKEHEMEEKIMVLIGALIAAIYSMTPELAATMTETTIEQILLEITTETTVIEKTSASIVKEIVEQKIDEEAERQLILCEQTEKAFPYREIESARASAIAEAGKGTAESMDEMFLSKALRLGIRQPDGSIKAVATGDELRRVTSEAAKLRAEGKLNTEDAVKQCVEHFGGGGGLVVEYGSGVIRRLDGVIAQIMRYNIKYGQQKYLTDTGKAVGANGYEVDYHPHPRPTHEPMGGVMFACGDKDITIDEKTYPSEEKVLADGKGARELLQDYNCLHFATPVILGVSQPRYDKDFLKKQKAADKEKIEYDGAKRTRYEWQQKQRALERAYRAEKYMNTVAKAANTPAIAAQHAANMREILSKYAELCNATGLSENRERMK